jgi:multimeric flavodoxin WrbA
MQTKILILKGSPRINGNSAVLADRVAAGAREAGAHVESFVLHDMDIRPCDACDTCRETGGLCVIKDEMETLYPLLRESDAILLASPIYWFTISAQLKTCIDRWYAMVTPDGHELSGKKIGIVLTYGDDDLYTSGAINAIYTFQSVFRYIEAEIAGMVYGTANDIGDAAMQPELMDKAYQLGLELAGST